MQLRRLDPLAKAGPYQRILATPVKSFSLTEAQYDRLVQQRPELVLIEDGCAVVARPHRDYLEVHYGFPDVDVFQNRFVRLFDTVVANSSKEEAPRGIVINFRDRPNRLVTETIFWPVALEQAPQWVEWNYVAVPEMPEPSMDLGDGLTVRPATEADHEAIRSIESAYTGKEPLTPAGVASILADAKGVFLVERAAQPLGFAYLRSEPGGWGVLDTLALTREAEDVRGALIGWSVAWLRNNGSRRMRTRLPIDDTKGIALVREAGFTPGETGLDYTRTVDASEVTKILAERQGHGTMIKFGDWR